MSFDKDLAESYDKIGKKIFNTCSFTKSSLQQSIDLFTEDSLKKRKPQPIDVEVYTLVSGLPFSYNLIQAIEKIRIEISEILDETQCYWVKPNNLGVEFCVFKWPKDPWNKEWIDQITSYFENKEYNSFELKVSGIQIHQDGCIIAKGFDDKNIRNIRSEIISDLNFIPNKQSNWAHIPLGRILEPVSEDIFKKLKDNAMNTANKDIAIEKISEMKLIHETRWYMEKRKTLFKKKFKL
jgi:hypothetical protein